MVPFGSPAETAGLSAQLADFTRFDAEFFPGTDLVYVLGGRVGETTDGTIYQFDPVTGDCSATGAVMPVPISNYTANLVSDGDADLLCTFGGRPLAGGTTTEVQCYDPVVNAASVVGSLPPQYSTWLPGAQVVVDNKVYVFGGFDPLATPSMTGVTFEYDPVAETWTQLGDLGLARSYIMAATVDGLIYAFGGVTFDGTSLHANAISELLDPAIGEWDDGALADLPGALAEGRSFGFDSASPFEFAGEIILAGGGQWPAETADVILYDVSSDTYDTPFPDLIDARRNHAAAFVGGLESSEGAPGMWVLGGRHGSDEPPYLPAERERLASGAAASGSGGARARRDAGRRACRGRGERAAPRRGPWR